jgi:hypothetical protein
MGVNGVLVCGDLKNAKWEPGWQERPEQSILRGRGVAEYTAAFLYPILLTASLVHGEKRRHLQRSVTSMPMVVHCEILVVDIVVSGWLECSSA